MPFRSREVPKLNLALFRLHRTTFLIVYRRSTEIPWCSTAECCSTTADEGVFELFTAVSVFDLGELRASPPADPCAMPRPPHRTQPADALCSDTPTPLLLCGCCHCRPPYRVGPQPPRAPCVFAARRYPEVASTNRQFRGIRKAQILLDGTQGVQFVGELQPQPNEMVVTKKRLSAAFDTELPVLLRSFLPEEVVRMPWRRPKVKAARWRCAQLLFLRLAGAVTAAAKLGAIPTPLGMRRCFARLSGRLACPSGARRRCDQRGYPLNSPVRTQPRFLSAAPN